MIQGRSLWWDLINITGLRFFFTFSVAIVLPQSTTFREMALPSSCEPSCSMKAS